MSSKMTKKPRAVISLRSADEFLVATTVKAASMSGTLKQALANLKPEDSGEISVIVKGEPLKRMVIWMDYHQNDVQPTMTEIKGKTDNAISVWDEKFLQMKLEELFDLIKAAEIMEVPGLLWLTTREVAQQIKGKTPEEIRHHFGIKDTWMPEELEMVINENKWCDEK